MKINYIFTLALVLIFSLFEDSKGDGSCGDWESFKDEKCVKLLDNIETHDGAVELCKKQVATATLVSILSTEEQDFLENYIFKKRGAQNSVWLGAKRNQNNKTTFLWDDGNKFDFSNWDKDDKHLEGDDCVEMTPQDAYYAEDKQGKWKDVHCTGSKKNQVLCQFPQSWTLPKLVKTFLEFRKDFKDFNALTNTEITNAKNNPVPLNFTYIQLPTQPEPSVLWPTVKWEDVSATYAGLFFRVLGGSSEKFGTIQAENSPRLASVESIETPKAAARPLKLDIPANGDVSGQIYVGSGPAAATQALDDHLRFKLTTGEVRPRNHAVKVWRRTK